MPSYSAILFDLDGTLADTAPDLAYALNTVLQQEGYKPLDYEIIRPVASNGSAGLLGLGFGITQEHADYIELQRRLIEVYENNIARETRLFDGMHEVLEQLEHRNIAWGIVTNKPAFLTDHLAVKLGLIDRAGCIVSGDTTSYSKPHPAPMILACKLLSCPPENCIYVGDAKRDIEAGKNANMHTITARYGYISDHDDPSSWQADGIIDHPSEILKWI